MARKRRRIKQLDGIYDATVKTGPDYMEGRLTVSQLVNQLKEETDSHAPVHLERAIRNERYFHGLQNYQGYGIGGADPTDEVGSYRNYLRNMVQTWSARFGEDRPRIKAYPTHAEGLDYHAAQLADAMLDDVHWREGMDAKLHEASILAQLHGKVAFKVTWNPEKGREIIVDKQDELTGEVVRDEDGYPVPENLGPQGEIEIEVVSMFQYDYGGGTHAHDAEWVIFTRYESEINARGFLRQELGHGVQELQSETYKDPDGKDREGIEICEQWHRPSPLVPKGLYAVVVGGHVAIAKDYPYEHGLLPICEWKINPLRHSRFATTHVDDAVPIQRLINSLEEAKVTTVRDTGVPTLLATGEIFSSLENNDNVNIIAIDDIQEIQQGAKYLDPPDPSPLVFEHQGEAVQAMYDIFGLNEVLVGKDSVKSGTSAKQIAYLSRLDSMKMSGPARNFEVAYVRMARMELSLGRQFMESDRLVRLAGPGGELLVLAINKADLFGYDVHLEPNSGMDKFRAQAAEEANEDLQRGQASPQEAAERAETGLGEAMGSAHDRQRAQMMVHRIMQGGPPQPDPTINPQVALETITRSMGIHPRFDDALRKLAQYYQGLLQKAQQNAPNPGQRMPQQQGQPKPRPQPQRRPQGQPTPNKPDEGPGLSKKGPL